MIYFYGFQLIEIIYYYFASKELINFPSNRCINNICIRTLLNDYCLLRNVFQSPNHMLLSSIERDKFKKILIDF